MQNEMEEFLSFKSLLCILRYLSQHKSLKTGKNMETTIHLSSLLSPLKQLIPLFS